MTSRVSLSWGPGDSSQTRRLAECDKSISRIATDVTELSAELARLRSEGKEMARLLLEQDALLREQRQVIASVEDERTLELRQRLVALAGRGERLSELEGRPAVGRCAGDR